MDLQFHRRITLALTLLLTSHLVMSAELFRWTDENGNVHYSDRIPPSQAQQPRVELNPYGQATKEVNTFKTKEQLRREREAVLEARRQKRLREKQLAEDRALLTTFSSLDDIDALYSSRLSNLDNYTSANRRKLEKTKALLEKTVKKKRWYQARERSVPRQITANIKEYEQQIATYELLIERNLAKRKKLETKFAHDKQRFLMLTGNDSNE